MRGAAEPGSRCDDAALARSPNRLLRLLQALAGRNAAC